MTRETKNQSSRAACQSKDKGAILLTTLMVMVMMAALAAAIMDDIRMAVVRAGNVQAAEQMDWYARGAEDFAQTWLTQQNTQNQSGLSTIITSGESVTFPLDDGRLAIKIRDGQNCLNVNAFTSKDTASAARIEFLHLLDGLGMSPSDAALLRERITDWVDADSTAGQGGAENYSYLALDPAYLAANRPMADITELRAIEGVSEEIYKAIQPYLCAPQFPAEYGETALALFPVNINTLDLKDAPYLASVLGGREAMRTAEAIIAERPLGGYDDLEAVLSREDFQDLELKGSANARLSLRTERAEIEIGIARGGQFRSYAVQYILPRNADAIFAARRSQF